MSKGCNNLIKTQKAHVLTSAADIIYHLGWELKESSKPIQTQLFVELDEEEQQIYDYLKDRDKQPIDRIAIETGIAVFKVATLLMNLELKGVIRSLPGKLFEVV